MNVQKKLRVLFLANVPVSDIAASLGGATVLAQGILDFIIKDSRLCVKAYPLRRTWKPKWHIIDHILWIFRFPFLAAKSDVISIHATWDFTFTTAPLVWLWAKLLNKKVVYHFFGGNFHEQYEALPGFLKWLYRKTLLSSDTVFLETKAQIRYFADKGISNRVWLPNARNPALIKRDEAPFSKRFVFISRVIPEKGIGEILEAAQLLPDDYVIDVYGPIDERYLTEKDFLGTRITYKGVLKPDEVDAALRQYDVLLLPTWFKYEGYPGIVLEALSMGIPVITTYWNSIPEIIEDDINGKLVQIKNPVQLYEAMMYFNEENYKKFSENALNSFDTFDSESVFRKIVNSYFE